MNGVFVIFLFKLLNLPTPPKIEKLQLKKQYNWGLSKRLNKLKTVYYLIPTFV
jgi:hypothetical protein